MGKSMIIIKKELARVFSDKKLVFSLFILPAVLVIGIYSLMGKMVDSMSQDIEEHIATVYMVNAPETVKQLTEATGYDKMAEIYWLDTITDSRQKELEAHILDGTAELMVTFEAGFEDKVAAYEQVGDVIPAVTVYYNTTGNYSGAARSVFKGMILDVYKEMLLGARLGNLELLTIYEENTVVIVDEDKANGEALAMMLPYLITMLLFAGAMSLCVDAITGEKERGTMASMLLTPIKRRELVIGKLVALSLLSAISAVVYAGAMIFAMPMMMSSMTDGASMEMNVSFSTVQIIELMLIMITLVYLYVAIVSLVSVIAKNAKEASTYVSPLYMLVLVLGMVTMFQGGQEKADVLFAAPVYGSALAIQRLMTNELTFVQFGLTAAGNVLLAAIVTYAITKAFNSEKIMFNA